MKIKRGTYLCIVGIILLLAALFLLIYNREEDSRAESRTADILAELKEQMPETQPYEEKQDETYDIFEDSDILSGDNYDQNQDEKIPPVDIFAEYEDQTGSSYSEETYYYVAEYSYIGILYIPKLGLELPVMSDWSYPNLRVAPCRYSGTVEGGDLIIAAHNYNCHFGRISELVPGDELIFVDGGGIQYTYTVIDGETIAGQNGAAMEANSEYWDLTLFTCTYSGASRVTIRAELVK